LHLKIGALFSLDKNDLCSKQRRRQTGEGGGEFSLPSDKESPFAAKDRITVKPFT
jgi:hypothetical protein